jgi:hypothetical protein
MVSQHPCLSSFSTCSCSSCSFCHHQIRRFAHRVQLSIPCSRETDQVLMGPTFPGSFKKKLHGRKQCVFFVGIRTLSSSAIGLSLITSGHTHLQLEVLHKFCVTAIVSVTFKTLTREQTTLIYFFTITNNNYKQQTTQLMPPSCWHPNNLSSLLLTLNSTRQNGAILATLVSVWILQDPIQQ